MNFYNLFENNFITFTPEIFLLFSILILLLFGVLSNTSANYVYVSRIVGYLSIFVLFITFCLVALNSVQYLIIFNGTLVVSEFISFFKLLVLISSICALVIGFNVLKYEDLNNFEYYILILFSILGSLILLSANDLITFYLALEMQSLSFYILASIKRGNFFSAEAGLKYFILGAFSSGLLLFGSSLLYGFTGSINFENIAKLLINVDVLIGANLYNGIVLSLIFIIISIFFKLTIVPFHMWGPDVYEGVPSPISAFLLIVPKIALLGFFFRFCFFIFYPLFSVWRYLVLFCAISSIIVSTLTAIRQKRIKRFLAYSSIGHLGFLLLGISSGTIEGIQSSLIYLIIYIISSINVWSIILSLEVTSSLKFKRIKYLTELTSLYKTNPAVAFALAVNLLSMAGIPPLAGFISKYFILLVSIKSSLYLAAFIGILMSVISCFYYIRLIKIIFFDKSSKYIQFRPIPISNAFIIASTLIFLLFFFVNPSFLDILTYKLALLVIH